MAIGNVSQLHTLYWNSATHINQLEDLTPAAVTERIVKHCAGTYYPNFTSIMAQNPEISFSTGQLQSLLGLWDASAPVILASSSNTDLHYKVVTNKGTATSSGERLRVASSALVLDSITAGHQQLAMARCRLIPVYDGTNDPIVGATATANPTSTPVNQHYGLGPVTIDGTEMDGVIDVSIATNMQLVRKGDASEPWPRGIYMLQWQPTFTIRTHNITNWDTYDMDGGAITSTGVAVWLRAKSANGINVANGTTSHIKVYTGTAHLVVESITGGNNDLPVATIVCQGYGVSALIVDTQLAIT